MKNNTIPINLPGNYFDQKDGVNYRFTILKDIAAAGDAVPVPYDDSHQDYILGLYEKYRDAALYVHFPWCMEHCSYCHYWRGPVIKRTELQKLLAAEQKYAAMLDQVIGLRSKNIPSIYFGGGTPTVLPADLLEEAIAFFAENYAGSHECEICLESSILTLKPKKIDILERYINRLSIGVQSFDDRILGIVERRHTSAQAREVLKEVVPRFPSVNIDLIFGLYSQTLDDWLASVETAVQLKVQSVTIYRLDIRETPSIINLYRQEPEKFPDEPTCRMMYEEARQILEAAGYRENLVGWFLLPQVKDTVVYRERWEKQSPCIAFGPALHNYAADHFYETLGAHQAYIDAVEAGKLPIRHIYPMPPERQLVWYVMAQWKAGSPIYKSVITHRFGVALLNGLMEQIQHYIAWNVLRVSADAIAVTREGHYLLEWVLLELIEAIEKKLETIPALGHHLYQHAPAG